MTNEQLAAIKARCEKATPGPWEVRSIEPEEFDAVSDDTFYIMADKWEVASITTYERVIEPDWQRDDDEADADFIAHAREDIPALLAEVERLRVALERVSKIYPTPYVRRICLDALGLQP